MTNCPSFIINERDFDRAQELYAAFFGDDITPLTGATEGEEEGEENDE